MNKFAIIDFETTGPTGPDDRAAEVGVVIVEGSRIVDRYASLMNSGHWMFWKNQNVTGITDDMIQSAPSANRVMKNVVKMISNYPLVAHWSSFDKRILDSELKHIGKKRRQGQEFLCTCLLGRRLYPEISRHTLEDLIIHTGITNTGGLHRAGADAEHTARLWIAMQRKLKKEHRLRSFPLELLEMIQQAPKGSLDHVIRNFRMK